MLDRPVVVRDDLELTSDVVPGEDPKAAQVGRLLAAAQFDVQHLRRNGIRYVLIDRTTAGKSAPEVTGTILHEGPDLELVDLGPLSPDPAGDTVSIWVLAADLAAALLTATAVLASFHRSVGQLIRSQRKVPMGG
jgi:hypothetical protein